MKEENKNGQLPEKEQLLSSLRNAEEMYVFMSLCTKMPYVLCDEETFDDEVLLYYTEEDAQREGKKLIEQRIPIQIAKIEKKQLLGFFSSLYPMGVNGLLINKNMESEARLQLGELVIRPNTEDLPDGKVWVENPQLHLTALYLCRRCADRKAGTDRRAERSAGRDTGQLWKRQIYRSRSQRKRNADAQTEERRCISADFHRYPGVSKIQ